MPTSIALSPHFESFIREQIESGRYNNVSEVVRAGLRILEEREQQRKLAAIQAAVNAGIMSGEGKDADAVFNRLDEKYRQMTDTGMRDETNDFPPGRTGHRSDR